MNKPESTAFNLIMIDKKNPYASIIDLICNIRRQKGTTRAGTRWLRKRQERRKATTVNPNHDNGSLTQLCTCLLKKVALPPPCGGEK